MSIAVVLVPGFVFLATSTVMSECVFTFVQLVTIALLAIKAGLAPAHDRGRCCRGQGYPRSIGGCTARGGRVALLSSRAGVATRWCSLEQSGCAWRRATCSSARVPPRRPTGSPRAALTRPVTAISCSRASPLSEGLHHRMGVSISNLRKRRERLRPGCRGRCRAGAVSRSGRER